MWLPASVRYLTRSHAHDRCCVHVAASQVAILHDFFGDDEGSDGGGGEDDDTGAGSSSDEDRKDGADTACAMRPNATRELDMQRLAQAGCGWGWRVPRTVPRA